MRLCLSAPKLIIIIIIIIIIMIIIIIIIIINWRSHFQFSPDGPDSKEKAGIEKSSCRLALGWPKDEKFAPKCLYM